MAETSTEVAFDPTSLGYEEVPQESFDPKSLGYEEVGDFDPASLGYEEVKPESGASFGDIMRRLPAGIAEAGAQTLAGGLKVAQDINNLIPSGAPLEESNRPKYDQLKEIESALRTDYQSKSKAVPFWDIAKSREIEGQFLEQIRPIQSLIRDLEANPDNAIGTAANFMRDVAERAKADYGVDTARDQAFLSQVASGTGSLVPVIASGPAAPFSAAAMMGESERAQAEEKGATHQQQDTAFYANAAVGVLSEALMGVPAILRWAKAAKIPEKTLRAMARLAAVQGLKGGILEGTQEAIEGAANDAIAKYIAEFDPERNPFDPSKRLNEFLVGAAIGAPTGAAIQTAEVFSRKESDEIEKAVDQELANLSTATPSEPTTQPLTQETGEVPTAPKASTFVSTAINTPQGIVTGKEQGTAHPEMILSAMEKGLSDEDVQKNLGFAFQTPEGTEWVDRVEAGKRLTESGQLAGLKEGEPLTSEHIRNEVPGVTFNPEPQTENAVQERPSEDVLRDVPEQPEGLKSEVPAEEGTQRVPRGAAQEQKAKVSEEVAAASEVKIPFVITRDMRQQLADLGYSKMDVNKLTPKEAMDVISEGKSKPAVSTEAQVNEAAIALNKFRTEALSVAEKAGATDADIAVSEAQLQISQKGSSDKALFLDAVRKQALKQLEKEGAQKRGGKLEPSQIEEETISETRGPRAESVSMEDVSSIEEAITRLPESQSKVMRALVENPGVSDSELAELTGMTTDAAKQAKSRARNTLREFIRKQGIGERMGPGAANQREFTKARSLLGIDVYEQLESEGSLTQENFEDRMLSQYEDIFTPEQIQSVWEMAGEASRIREETKGRKPYPVIIDQLLGAPTGEGETALKNAQAELERKARNLPPAAKAARKSDTALWDQAQKVIQDDPQYQSELVDRLIQNPQTVLQDTDLMVLLDAKIKAENEYGKTLDKYNGAQDEQTKAIQQKRLNDISKRLQDIYDVAKIVGTEQGRAFRARRLLVSRDYSIGKLSSELEAAKGDDLNSEDRTFVQETSQKASEAQSALESRIDTLEEGESVRAAEARLKELQAKLPFDQRILDIANKIVAKLDSAADRARQRIRSRMGRLNLNFDPTALYDWAVIGASKLAHGLRDVAWKNAMKSELDAENVEYDDAVLDQILKESNRQIDTLEENVPEPDRKQVRNAVRKTGTKDILDDTKSKIRTRIEDGESLSDLRSYVQKLSLAYVRAGLSTVQEVTDAVHGFLKSIDPNISKRQAMDLWSGYGDFKALDKETAKQTLRDLKGQAQNLAKLEDIQSKQPLQKTGVERRTPSDTERRLIKQVNQLKKKMGVVVTDPERQLKSALDQVRNTVRNQIADLTHQLETGEKPLPGTPSPTDEQIERMKQTRDALRKTLKDLEGKPEATNEQRIALAEKALERSISDLETRIKNKDTSTIQSKQPESAKLGALRAKRDALRDSLNALKEADQNLQDTKTFDRLIKQAEELEAKLSRGEVEPKTKAERIEDELVTQLRERITGLREKMTDARRQTPEFKQRQLDDAVKSLEDSIASLDAKLQKGDVSPTPRTPRVSSPILERLRAERDAMNKLLRELRKAPSMSPEEKGIKALKARLTNQIADLQSRVASDDFSKRAVRHLDISKDPEAVRLTAERNRVLNEFNEKRYQYELKNASLGRKVYNAVAEGVNTAKSSVGSLDLSAFGRQALKATLSHPVMAFRNLITSIQAMNKAKLDQVNAQIENRTNARNGNYKTGKVQFTGLEGALSGREEAFRSDLAKKIPWVKWSERQYVTFLNLMRADLFDYMVKAGPTNPTPEQIRAIGRAVNIATGRGELGKYSGAADALSVPFWSPRLYVSRLQTLVAYDVLHGDAKGIRKTIAKEYVRAAASGLAILTAGILAGADVEDDPASSDYGKLRFGDTRIDPWGGHQQWLVFLTRILSGKYTTTKGEEFSMFQGEKRPGPYDPTYGDTILRMLRSKLNPIAGAIWDYKEGRDIQGREVSGGKALMKATLPLSIFNDDIGPIAEEWGMDKAALAQLLNTIGIGVQHYEAKD